MKKWLMILGCSFMLCGCTESNIVSQGGELEPDFAVREGIELEWEQAFDDMNAEYVDDENIFNMAYFMDGDDDDGETLYITSLVRPNMSSQEAAQLGTTMIKSLNDFFSDQDFSLERSTSSGYGGFFDLYNVCIRIIPEDQTENEEMALVNDLIMTDEAYRPVEANR